MLIRPEYRGCVNSLECVCQGVYVYVGAPACMFACACVSNCESGLGEGQQEWKTDMLGWKQQESELATRLLIFLQAHRPQMIVSQSISAMNTISNTASSLYTCTELSVMYCCILMYTIYLHTIALSRYTCQWYDAVQSTTFPGNHCIVLWDVCSFPQKNSKYRQTTFQLTGKIKTSNVTY